MYGILVLFGVVSLIFVLFHVIPGDPVRMMMGQRGDEASIRAMEKEIGRDLPVTVQYIKYLNDLSPLSIHDRSDPDHFLYLDDEAYSYLGLVSAGNKILVLKFPYLRRSYQTKKKVVSVIADALPATLLLTSAAICFAFIFGILLGILGALNQNGWIDRSLLVLTTIGMSGPSFFMAILVSWLFGYVLSGMTGLDMTGSMYEIDDFTGRESLALGNLILPALTLGIRPLSVVMQLMRNALLDVMSRDYIRTARAKGLPEWKVIGKHAVRNSLNPVVTAISGWFAGMLAGAVFVEMIFAWKGLGWEIVNALEQYDLPVVMGAVIVISAIFVIINIIVDLIYTYLDPRVKLEH